MTAPKSPRKPVQDPFAGKTDVQVLRIAQDAYFRAEALAPRSVARKREWQVFDTAMGELMVRAMSHVLWQIHERERQGATDVPDPHVAEVIVDLMKRNGSGMTGPAEDRRGD